MTETHRRSRLLPATLHDRCLLLFALALGAALRLMDVNMPLIDAFSWRQASTAMMADNFYQTSWNIFYPEVNWTGPGPSYQGREFQLFTYIVAALHSVFGWHDWFGRLVATGFGLITLFGLHRLVEAVWDRMHAHAAALAYALLPAAVMMDSSFLPDAGMLALVTIGIWFFVLYWQGDRRKWLLPAATLAFTFGVLTKLPGLAAGLVVLYLITAWVARGQVRLAIPVLVAAAAALATVVAYYAWAIHLGRSYPPYHVAGSGYIWDSGFRAFLRDGFYLTELRRIAVNWFYGTPLIIMAVVGLWIGPPWPRRRSALAYVPHVWFAACVLLYFAAAKEISANPWNLHFLSVPMAIFVSRAGIFVVTLGRRSTGLGAGIRPANTAEDLYTATRAAALLVGLLAFVTLPLYAVMKHPYALNAKLLGEEMARLSMPDDLVIAVSPTVGDPTAIYYSRRRGWVFPPGGGNLVWSLLRDDTAEALSDLADMQAAGARWFGVTKDARDARGRRFIEHHAEVLEYLEGHGSRVADTDAFLIYELSD